MLKKGFTLVELLAVIVILGVLMAIIVPQVQRSIDASKDKMYDVAVSEIIKAAKNYTVEYGNDIEGLKDSGIGYLTVNELVTNGALEELPKNPKDGGTFSGAATIRITVASNGKYNFQFYTSSPPAVNVPILAAGMKPIKWDGNAWVETTESDSSWFNYNTTDKKWANAKTSDGSMWVWIPRFIYKISSEWHSSTTGTIEVKFSKGIDDTIDGTITLDTGTGAAASDTTTNGDKYTNHPAFKFGNTELAGIWVAKFEATAVEGVTNGYNVDGSCPLVGDNVSTKTVKIIPNAMSWRCINQNNTFLVSRNMETKAIYGWGTSGDGLDTHQMKNTEWGAVAYLSKSNYGRETSDIWINPADNFTTGCAGDSESSTVTTGCLRSYETTNGQKASTTGNIYGIYDMSGGAGDRTTAYVNNGSYSLANNGSIVISADDKYKNVYAVGSLDDQYTNYASTINQKGDAIYEISGNINGFYGWFGNSLGMPNTIYPWFSRGGGLSSANGAGLYCSSVTAGNAYNHIGFRPVLLVAPNL